MQVASDGNVRPEFYSVEDMQRLLGIGRNTAYRLAAEKNFPAIYVGNRIVIPADLFQEWIRNRAFDRKAGRHNGKNASRQG